MKRFLGLVLAGAMALSLVACGGETKEDFKLLRGTYTDNIYTNESTGISFTMPEGWSVIDDDELLSTYGVDVDADEFANWTSEDFADAMVIPDTRIVRDNNTENMSVIYENLKKTGGTKYTMEQYMNQATAQLSGYTVSEPTQTTVCGLDAVYVIAETTLYGTPVSQYLLVVRVDDYMTVITYTTIADTTVDQFLDMFN